MLSSRSPLCLAVSTPVTSEGMWSPICTVLILTYVYCPNCVLSKGTPPSVSRATVCKMPSHGETVLCSPVPS